MEIVNINCENWQLPYNLKYFHIEENLHYITLAVVNLCFFVFVFGFLFLFLLYFLFVIKCKDILEFPRPQYNGRYFKQSEYS